VPAQTAHNILIAYKAETTFNVAPTNTGAFRFRPNAGTGLELVRTTINPGEIRSDLQSPMGRLGSGSVTGTFPGDLSVGSFDPLLEAALRGTWVAAVNITQATMTSITTTAGPPGTIVAAGGSWITQGVRVGDVVRLTGHAQAGNNNRNLRVTAVTTTTITVAETLIADAAPDATFTLTIARKVTNQDVPVRRSFYFERYDQDIDQSILYGGCRVASLNIIGAADAMAIIEVGFLGASATEQATGASPFFVSPTLSTTTALVFADATIREGGVDVVNLTGMNITLDLTAGVVPVIGSPVPFDVFDNRLNVSGTISAVRGDLTRFTRFRNETEAELSVLLVEPEAEPKDFLHIFIPRIKLTSVAAPFGGENAVIETANFIVGKKEEAGTTQYDDTTVVFSTSAP